MRANDKDTKEVLAEMEQDGITKPGAADNDADDGGDESETEDVEETEKPEGKDADGDEDSEDEDGEVDAEKSEEEEEESDDESDESEDESEDEDDDGEADDEDEGVTPKGKHVSLGKHQRVKQKLKDRIAELERQVGSKGTTDEDLKAEAEEAGMTVEAYKKVINRVRKEAIPPELKQRLDAFDAAQLERHQGTEFLKEFKALAEKYPEIKEQKSKLRELAFKGKNTNRPLSDIYFMDVKPGLRTKKKSAEPSRGGAGRGASDELDFDAIKADPALMSKLSDAEFDKYIAWEKTNKKSRIIKSDR